MMTTPLGHKAGIAGQYPEERQALGERRIRLALAPGEIADLSSRKPSFAHRLDQVESAQDQEYIRNQEQAGGAFMWTHVAE